MGAQQQPSSSLVDRAKRVESHALVEVRRYRSLPFFCHSGVLLDISVGGFKLEFTNEILVSPGQRFWLVIPLSPLGIYAPKKLMCQVEVRWFDALKFRIGGIFFNLTRTEALIIDQVVTGLESRARRAHNRTA